MTATTPAISPLRQRMIDDMRLRKFADKTQSHYLRAVRQFSLFLGHSPDRATIEDLRRYQLHLVDQGTSAISLNAAIAGLKFFFDVTLDHQQLIRKMQSVRIPRTLPVVLSREFVKRSFRNIRDERRRPVCRAKFSRLIGQAILPERKTSAASRCKFCSLAPATN